MVDAFNGDISDWNISSVTGMTFMFSSAYAFNGDLSSWDTSRVTNMGGMFQHTRAFNGNISDWDVSGVSKITNIFRSSAFDQNLGNWYITLNNTAIDRAGVLGIVRAISAQNSELDGHNPVYKIGPSDDMEHFEIIDGMLRLKSLKANPAKNVYEANITASDVTVFGTNNSRTINVMVVTSQNNPSPSVNAGLDQTVPEGSCLARAILLRILHAANHPVRGCRPCLSSWMRLSPWSEPSLRVLPRSPGRP